jgi:hypothetical protein
MKMLPCLILAALAVTTLTGCNGFSRVVSELKNDPATVKAKLIAPGYSFEFERSFPTNWTPTQPLIKP